MTAARVVFRGFARLAGGARRRWGRLPGERRLPAAAGVAAAALLVAVVPFGPAVCVGVLLVAAVWAGRGEEGPEPVGEPDVEARLAMVYEALVPFFASAADPSPEPLYVYGGAWERCFTSVAFGGDGRLARLRLRYPAFFPDGDEECRGRVERLLAGKAGREREFRFRWDEERGELEMVVLGPLPTGIGAQRFVTGPGEVVLGFTDPDVVDRTVPVLAGPDYAARVNAAPVVWRTGVRAAHAHLLAVALPGAGATSLLRSLALQALDEGDVLLVDGCGAGGFGCFAGRAGVVAAESSPGGAVAALEWAARETERRLLAGGDGVVRPLWIVVDRPGLLRHLARVEGLRDPLALLDVPLRFGRAGRVTVALAEQFEGLAALGGAVPVCARARVVLGAVSGEQAGAVLGVAPRVMPSGWAPPGRGFARLGTGPVLRLQVPATPDPGDAATDEMLRRAVLALLPQRAGAVAPRGGGD
ncbi:hypothetical protein [Streptomyces radicis]|uniref:FtsK domain-containing protein n=1 Tax=Streptomyces radicis TaxID=1750517 RepID=A0A3A9VUI1_9ACTN|nr:hypothetical protein [Streptomyces radicis]RKN04400.1 hypothetical protein D7319_28370 [Streptomyces radicis]RKN15168.1 hypothetical protein D7318_27775 [Streptomyces radicis]